MYDQSYRPLRRRTSYEIAQCRLTCSYAGGRDEYQAIDPFGILEGISNAQVASQAVSHQRHLFQAHHFPPILQTICEEALGRLDSRVCAGLRRLGHIEGYARGASHAEPVERIQTGMRVLRHSFQILKVERGA